MIGAGVLVWFGSAIYDVATAPYAARRYNARYGRAMSLAPVVGAQSGVRLAVRL